MQAWQIEGGWGLENLKQIKREAQAPGPGKVAVRLRAASLNFRDYLTVLGMYNPKQTLPLIPCSDGAGEVVAVGDGVTRFKVGDRVIPIFAQGWMAGEPSLEKVKGSTLGGPLDGTLASEIVISEQGLVATPPHLTDDEAACLGCAGVTAWSAVIGQGRVRPGETVLVQGTGGVAMFAAQFARLAGARAIFTSGSAEKIAKLATMGFHEAINYRENPNWSKPLRAMTGGLGADHIVEVGGAGTLQESLKAVRFGGKISVIGVLAGTVSEVSVIPILMQNVRVQGVLVGSRDDFEQMNRALTLHQVRPVISHRFGFDEAPKAFETMASGAHFGKIVVGLEG